MTSGAIPEYRDIIIAVHGIGDQVRNATVRDVATRFARLPSLAGAGIFVAPQPLGYFHTDVTDAVKVSPLGAIILPDSPLAKIGFSEVYWADIPDVVVQDGHTMDETKAWARTIVSRVRAAYYRTKSEAEAAQSRSLSAAERLQMTEPDFTLVAEVLEEIIDTVQVLENLFFLAKKAGIAEFELGRMLQQFVGDVQVVTEFQLFRRDILGRLHAAMEQIHRDHPQARLHIIAHSEGTVIGFLALLHALCGTRIVPKTGGKPGDLPQGSTEWVKNVAGFFTIGSPIDKHLLLWPELFSTFDFSNTPPVADQQQIQWRNYYDFGDPVGFKLDTARRWLKDVGCTAFDFTRDDGIERDFGFARYLLPGKAHTDYWTDAAVFEHMVHDVVLPGKVPADPPPTRRMVYLLSPLIPYGASFVLLYTGALLLHRALSQFLHPSLEVVQSYALWSQLGTVPKLNVPAEQLYQESLGLALLYGGTTLLARWPRLAKGLLWWLAGIAAFGVGCLGYVTLLQPDTKKAIGSLFGYYGLHETLWTLVAAFLVALIGLTAVSKPNTDSPKARRRTPGSDAARTLGESARDCAAVVFNSKAPRKSRWFSKRMRPLVVCGAILIAGLTAFQMAHPQPPLSLNDRAVVVNRYVGRKTLEFKRAHGGAAPDTESIEVIRKEAEERADQFISFAAARAPGWPMLLAGAAFLYLWWLAALIFDLGFIWQRYIRRSFSLTKLEQWRQIRTKCSAERLHRPA